MRYLSSDRAIVRQLIGIGHCNSNCTVLYTVLKSEQNNCVCKSEIEIPCSPVYIVWTIYGVFSAPTHVRPFLHSHEHVKAIYPESTAGWYHLHMHQSKKRFAVSRPTFGSQLSVFSEAASMNAEWSCFAE